VIRYCCGGVSDQKYIVAITIVSTGKNHPNQSTAAEHMEGNEELFFSTKKCSKKI
jgi:hypothetical protein